MAGDGVIIVVTPDGVRVVDTMTGVVLKNVFVKDISYMNTMPSDKKREVFAFISRDTRINRLSCHVFDIQKGKGLKICEAVAKAFEAYVTDTRNTNALGAQPDESQSDVVDIPPLLAARQTDRSKLTDLKVIGSGVYGKVHLVDQELEDGTTVQRAVKLLRNNRNKSHTGAFVKEFEAMIKVECEQCIRLVGVSVEAKPWLAVLEFMQYGDLLDVLQTLREKNFDLFPTEQLHLTSQLAKGMEYITSQRFVHLDLAARNCLLHSNNVVKVADFGLCRPYNEGKDYWLMTETLKLAVKWIPPECLETKRFSERSDIWAMGVTMWEIMSYGAVPFAGTRVPEIPKMVKEGLRLGQPPKCADDIYAIMQKCWHEDPEKRWTFEGIVHVLKGQFEDASTRYPPPRDVGALLNAQLSSDVRSLSVSVHKKQASLRRSKSGAAGTVQPVVEVSEEPAPAVATGRFADVSESRMRVTSISAVRRRGSKAAALNQDSVVLATEVTFEDVRPGDASGIIVHDVEEIETGRTTQAIQHSLEGATLESSATEVEAQLADMNITDTPGYRAVAGEETGDAGEAAREEEGQPQQQLLEHAEEAGAGEGQPQASPADALPEKQSEEAKSAPLAGSDAATPAAAAILPDPTADTTAETEVAEPVAASPAGAETAPASAPSSVSRKLDSRLKVDTSHLNLEYTPEQIAR